MIVIQPNSWRIAHFCVRSNAMSKRIFDLCAASLPMGKQQAYIMSYFLLTHKHTCAPFYARLFARHHEMSKPISYCQTNKGTLSKWYKHK